MSVRAVACGLLGCSSILLGACSSDNGDGSTSSGGHDTIGGRGAKPTVSSAGRARSSGGAAGNSGVAGAAEAAGAGRVAEVSDIAGVAGVAGVAKAGGTSSQSSIGGTAGAATTGGWAGQSLAANAAGAGTPGGTAGQSNTSATAGFATATGTAGQSNAGTIGTLLPNLNRLVLNINIADGAVDYENDTYTIDLTTGRLDYLHVASNRYTPLNVSVTDAKDATASQIAELATEVLAVSWREQPDCFTTSMDGTPYAPRLTVFEGQTQVNFGATDAPCHASDHSASGKIMSCASFNLVVSKVLAIRPGGTTVACMSYW